MLKKQFIAVMHDDNFNQNVYHDLRNDNRVIVLNGVTKQKPKSFLQKILYRVQFGRLCYLLGDVPFKKKIWGFTLDDIEWKPNINYYIWITNPGGISTSYLNNLKNKYNIKYIMSIGVPLDTNELFSRYIKRFIHTVNIDYIFTSSTRNASKYHYMIFEPFPRYSMLLDNTPDDSDYDLYLIANNLGNRLNKFYAVFEYLKKQNVNIKFKLNSVKESERKFENEIIYFDKEIPYVDVIKETKKTNCILEVLREDYTTTTLRYCEAVCYNKKLLTNNKNVVNLPFYNPDYIRIFEKPEDIDCDWVKERIPINYGYDGRFSPTYLIDKIIEFEEK